MRRKEYLPIAKDPTWLPYHEKYDKLRLTSKILNSGNQRVDIHAIIWDRRNVEIAILTMVGNAKKQYARDGLWVTALIPLAERNLAEINREFAEYQWKRKNMGYGDWTTWPKELLIKRLEAEAKVDVLQEELEQLQKWLEKDTEKQTQIADGEILAYGLKCAGRLHGLRSEDPELVNVLAEIDGQKVSQWYESDNILIIDDKRSPYDGMAVADYRKLAEQWNADRRAADKEKLKRLQEAAKAAGRPVPSSYVRPIRKNDKSNLPEFPKWATNFKKQSKLQDK